MLVFTCLTWNKNYEKQFGEDWTKRFLKTYRFSVGHINPHMHKIGPRGPKHFIFGHHF